MNSNKVLLALAASPLRWALYTLFAIGIISMTSIVAFFTGPVILLIMLFDPSTPLWVPITIFCTSIIGMFTVVIYADYDYLAYDSPLYPNPTTNTIDWTVVTILGIAAMFFTRTFSTS